MDSARQILRWSLPGLVFVLNLLLLHGVWLAFVLNLSPWGFISQATAPALVAVVAGGLPAGFILYQLYFHGYGGVGFSLPRNKPRYALFFRRDRGGSVLRAYRYKYRGAQALVACVDFHPDAVGLFAGEIDSFEDRIADPKWTRFLHGWMRPTEHLHDPTKPPTFAPWRCPDCIEIYSRRWAQNWTLFQSMIDYCSSKEDRRWIKAEYTSGSDLYHCLGAARTSIWVALVVAFFYDCVRDVLGFGSPPFLNNELWRYAIFLLIALALTLSQIYVLWRCRDQLSRNYEERIAAALAFASREIGTTST